MTHSVFVYFDYAMNIGGGATPKFWGYRPIPSLEPQLWMTIKPASRVTDLALNRLHLDILDHAMEIALLSTSINTKIDLRH